MSAGTNFNTQNTLSLSVTLHILWAHLHQHLWSTPTLFTGTIFNTYNSGSRLYHRCTNFTNKVSFLTPKATGCSVNRGTIFDTHNGRFQSYA